MSEGDGPFPYVVVMPYVGLKELKRDLKRWAGPWSVHSAWALDKADLDAYLMVSFQDKADQVRYERELAGTETPT